MVERIKPRATRCAIYTRKSTEEGLEQDFNSLHAQREACEAYITSQKHEGWRLIDTAYDDGGVSGGSMDRPALQSLLGDVDGGKVDAVVVYKVDRLTRSLTDFAKIVERFDARGVSFVSVTQAFNTTTSMGRLTLNVLLSFAQFEREVTGERIRDKIAASKKKGLWMGGFPPVGYKPKDRTLAIDEAEAKIVHTIFELYLKHGTVRAVHSELAKRKIGRPSGVSVNGHPYGGRPFSRGQLYKLLSNPVYIGQISHKGLRHDGLHKAIIDRTTWDAAQAKLAQNTHQRRVRSNAKESSLLAGLLYDGNGNRLAPTQTSKQGRRYRYYGVQSAAGAGSWRIPAAEIESAVIDKICAVLNDNRWLMEAVGLDRLSPSDMQARLKGAATLTKSLTSASASGQRALLLDLLQRVVIERSELHISLRTRNLMLALPASAGVRANHDAARETKNQKTEYPVGAIGDDIVTISVPVAFRRRGVETKLIIEGGASSIRAQPDAALIKTVARAHVWFEELVSGKLTMTELAAREGMKVSSVAKLLPLAFFAPDIVEAILVGHQAPTAVAHHLIRSDLPMLWQEQRASLLSRGGNGASCGPDVHIGQS